MFFAACSSGGDASTNSGSIEIVDPVTPRSRFRFPPAPAAPPADTQSTAAAPIFPIGDADSRLDVQELIVGVLKGDGLRAIVDATGDEIAAHEAFSFAWRQFHPSTQLFEH